MGTIRQLKRCASCDRQVAEVDILPFGEIVDSECKIKLQPHEDTELNLLGFDEAYANAIPVIISSDPFVEVKIALPGSVYVDQELVLEWVASDSDGDELTYQIDYSADGGVSWVNLSSN